MATISLGKLFEAAALYKQAAKIARRYDDLNATIVQILNEHLEEVLVRYATSRPQDWYDPFTVLEVVYGEYVLKIPAPELRRQDWELAEKVRVKMTPKQVGSQVQKGMELLDKVMPNWVDQISLSLLDMNLSYCHVIGQLFFRGQEPPPMKEITRKINELLGITEEDWFFWTRPIWYGFDPVGRGLSSVNELTEEWREAILQRRDAK